MTETLLVNRKDFADVALVKSPPIVLQAGCIRVSVGPWALTANNITYMVTGEQIGYWKFFNPQHYGIDMAGFGRMPVWGYGTITETNCEGLAVGAEIYGFFPIADTFDMKPVKISPHGFQDGADHRTALHPIYNSYTMISSDPSFAVHKALQPVLRPLFTTSFLIDDFLDSEKFFEAEQVLLLSASSKTALGTAFCLRERGGIKVAGLTSEGNIDFVKETGFYDQLLSYDTITDFNPDVKTIVVDMAGNGDVTHTVYEHFEENILYNCMVGKSHWQGRPPKRPELGAPPIMFFAPDRAKQRFSDWGGDGFAKKLGQRWMPFCESASSWLSVNTGEGVESFLKSYKAFLEGQASPFQGYLFKL